jgi:hypothetical protein
MKILYYYYFLFYTKILSDDQPHATTIFTLSVSESFLIIGVLQLLLAYLFCVILNKWQMMSIALLIIGINYFLYWTSGKAKKIIKMKPKILNNNKLSVFFVVCFFVITFSTFILSMVYVKQIMEEYCK